MATIEKMMDEIKGMTVLELNELVKALGMTGISKSQVSRLCEDIDERVGAFLSRPIAFAACWPRLLRRSDLPRPRVL